jgi:protein-tyrosine-phosphatase
MNRELRFLSSALGTPRAARWPRDFDYVISVCARAAETCPKWPRSREQIRWHFDDPAEATGTVEERLRVFRRVRNEIQQRLSLMMLAAKVPVTLPKASKA